MRITTFNMRQGGSHTHWAEVLAHTAPDVLLVQESRDPSLFASDLVQPLDLHGLAWAGVNGYRWGSAVLVGDGGVRPVEVPGFGGWVTGGEARFGDHEVQVFSVHLPPTNGSYVRTANRLLDELAPVASGGPVILGGDWNLTVSRRDLDDPVAHKAGEVDLLARLREEFGSAPAWRMAHPSGALPQTLRWMKDPATPYHCDGVFLPLTLSASVPFAQVLESARWTELSDHNPLVVEWEV